MAVFVDLFTTNMEFREAFLTMKLAQGSNINLEALFEKENELVAILVGGLQNGIISNNNVNETIHELYNERIILGNHQAFPISLKPTKTIDVENDMIPCSFQLPISLHNTDPLKDLGDYISHLANNFMNKEALTINLNGMINAYNEIIKGTNLKKIEVQNIGRSYTISRNGIVMMTGDKSVCDVPNNLKILSMYNANLTNIPDSQLLDVLVYIDSLRSSDGIKDTRYINLQNEITHELASRRSGKNISVK
jgi:hypothetical protein